MKRKLLERCSYMPVLRHKKDRCIINGPWLGLFLLIREWNSLESFWPGSVWPGSAKRWGPEFQNNPNSRCVREKGTEVKWWLCPVQLWSPLYEDLLRPLLGGWHVPRKQALQWSTSRRSWILWRCVLLERPRQHYNKQIKKMHGMLGGSKVCMHNKGNLVWRDRWSCSPGLGDLPDTGGKLEGVWGRSFSRRENNKEKGPQVRCVMNTSSMEACRPG